MNGISFINSLSQLDYFKHTSPSNLEPAKAALKKHFEEGNLFMTGFSDQWPHPSLDLRFYNCSDCEDLFESGGVPDLLEEMSTLFEKLHLSIDYKEDNYAEEGHTIKVNGTNYIMAQGSILMWGETFVKFAEMINNELTRQKAGDRIYLLDADDNSYMVFLTEKQHEFLTQCIPAGKCPLRVEEYTKRAIENITSLLN